MSGHDRVKRQLSVSSDSKLLDEDIREETRVILRPKKPPRPKSEVLLNEGSHHRRTKRYSAFGVSERGFRLHLFSTISKLWAFVNNVAAMAEKDVASEMNLILF